MRYQTVLAIFFVVCQLLTKSSAQENGARGRFLQEVLRELSRRNGDVFALELFAGEKGVQSSYEQLDFNVINAYTSSEKLLRAYFPQYEVVRSRAQPALYFVIARQTNRVDSYAMKTRLNDFRFEGDPAGLIARIGDTVPSIQKVAFNPIPDINNLLFPFVVSKIGVSLQGGDVRDVLSACIDFQKTKGIVWVATTRVNNGEQHTEIAYTSDAVFSEVR